MTEPTWNPMRQAFDRPPSLAEFLLARIGEDEVEARTVMASTEVGVDLEPLALSWEHDRDYGPTGYLCINPARVLAECEAKRRIVSYASTLARVADDEGRRRNGADMLCLLALPYADRPDYREEWKP